VFEKNKLMESQAALSSKRKISSQRLRDMQNCEQFAFRFNYSCTWMLMCFAYNNS